MHNALAFVSSLELAALPGAGSFDTLARGIDEWRLLADRATDPIFRDAIIRALEVPQSKRWLEALFGNSPFLTRLALRDPERVALAAPLARNGLYVRINANPVFSAITDVFSFTVNP